jgi:hypothetical protein
VSSAVLVVLPAGAAQAAPLNSTPLITYNMQGARSGQDSKWNLTIGSFIEQAEIVAVQEAGPTPPGVQPQGSSPVVVPGLPQIGRAGFIQHHRWQYRHASYEVYFLQTDQQGGRYTGGRNNVALVTHREADEVWAVPSTHANGRAALGVRFDNDWYFTFHARSLGGQPNDSEDMLASIATFVNQVPGRTWTVMGDFNMEPGTFPIPPGSALYNSGLPTHQNGEEYDYAVGSVAIQDHPVRRVDAATSDHTFGVGIGGLRAAAEPKPLFTSPRYIENMQNGGVLDPLGSGHGAPITTHERTGNDDQKWDIEFIESDQVRIGQVGGRCLSANPDRFFRFTLSLDDCSDTLPTQRWKLLSLDNEQYQVRSLAAGRCMDVQTATDPRLLSVALKTCADVDGQHWMLAPPHDPSAAPNFQIADLPVAFEGSAGLENLQTGRMLAVEPRAISDTALRAYPHRTTPVPNREEWGLDWLDGNRLRLHDRVSDLCVESTGEDPNPLSVGLRPCNDSTRQTWEVEPYGENIFRLHSSRFLLEGDACLNLDVLAGRRTFDLAETTPCDNHFTSQLWFFSPYSTQ